MRVPPPTNPFHIARAYGTQGPRALTPAQPVAPAQPAAKAVTGAARLVAAAVQGRIDFSADAPAHAPAALAMYRHPADRNAAATAVHVGRSIDVAG